MGMPTRKPGSLPIWLHAALVRVKRHARRECSQGVTCPKIERAFLGAMLSGAGLAEIDGHRPDISFGSGYPAVSRAKDQRMGTNGRTVTVFGGTGFLGRRIVRHLRYREFLVRIASRHPDRGHSQFGRDDPQLRSVQADIHDERSVADALAGAYAV